MAEQTTLSEQKQIGQHDGITPSHGEKQTASVEHYEHGIDSHGNLSYENAEEEPEIHATTYVALLAMFMFVSCWAKV